MLSAGDLDPSFGAGGTVLTDLGGPSRASGVVVQADGGVVAVGAVAGPEGASDFVVTRFASIGVVDPAFGVGGSARTDVTGAGAADIARAVVQQPDGKLVVVGVASAGTPSARFAVVRYLPDGTLDTSFGVGGVVLTHVPYGPAEARSDAAAVAVASDGRIVVVGTVIAPGQYVASFGWAIARYLPDGSADTSFGNGGIAVVAGFPGGGFDRAAAVVLQPDGKIVVGGGSGENHYRVYLLGSNFALARLLPNGRLDSTFGESGRVVTTLTGFSSAQSLLLQRDGKLVAVGYDGHGLSSRTPTRRIALVRYRTNGTLDPYFGSGGVVHTDVRGDNADDEASAAALRPDGRIVIAGHIAEPGVATQFLVGQYRANGTPDTAFGGTGFVTTDFGPVGTVQSASAVALHLDGRIVAAGGAGSFVAVARYLR